jgi:hypothetical protein
MPPMMLTTSSSFTTMMPIVLPDFLVNVLRYTCTQSISCFQTAGTRFE